MTSHRDDHDDLALLTEQEEATLAEALRAALVQRPLDEHRNEELIAAALASPLAPPSPEELVESARLREALDHGPLVPDALLLRALAEAAGPKELPRERLSAIVEQALASKPRRGTVVWVTFGVATGATALAAGALLAVGPVAPRAAPPNTAAFVTSHTTSELFTERYAPGETTERVDRIAVARQRELRKNRYLGWGVE